MTAVVASSAVVLTFAGVSKNQTAHENFELESVAVCQHFSLSLVPTTLQKLVAVLAHVQAEEEGEFVHVNALANEQFEDVCYEVGRVADDADDDDGWIATTAPARTKSTAYAPCDTATASVQLNATLSPTEEWEYAATAALEHGPGFLSICFSGTNTYSAMSFDHEINVRAACGVTAQPATITRLVFEVVSTFATRGGRVEFTDPALKALLRSWDAGLLLNTRCPFSVVGETWGAEVVTTTREAAVEMCGHANPLAKAAAGVLPKSGYGACFLSFMTRGAVMIDWAITTMVAKRASGVTVGSVWQPLAGAKLMSKHAKSLPDGLICHAFVPLGTAGGGIVANCVAWEKLTFASVEAPVLRNAVDEAFGPGAYKQWTEHYPTTNALLTGHTLLLAFLAHKCRHPFLFNPIASTAQPERGAKCATAQRTVRVFTTVEDEEDDGTSAEETADLDAVIVSVSELDDLERTLVPQVPHRHSEHVEPAEKKASPKEAPSCASNIGNPTMWGKQ